MLGPEAALGAAFATPEAQVIGHPSVDLLTHGIQIIEVGRLIKLTRQVRGQARRGPVLEQRAAPPRHQHCPKLRDYVVVQPRPETILDQTNPVLAPHM